MTIAQDANTPARKADIRKPASPHLFRRMRLRAFQEAYSRPDTVINAMDWTRELGLTTWPKGHRSALATLPEALEVLRRGPGILEEVSGWVMVGY